MKIREYQEKDFEQISQLYFELHQYFAQIDALGETPAFNKIEPAREYMRQMVEDAHKMAGKIYVAEESAQLIGFAQGVIIEHKAGEDKIYDLTHKPSKAGWIGLLYVAPEHRKQGIGQKLVDAMKEYYRSQGCTSVRLFALADNKLALNFYHKNGFLPHDVEMACKL